MRYSRLLTALLLIALFLRVTANAFAQANDPCPTGTAGLTSALTPKNIPLEVGRTYTLSEIMCYRTPTLAPNQTLTWYSGLIGLTPTQLAAKLDIAPGHVYQPGETSPGFVGWKVQNFLVFGGCFGGGCNDVPWGSVTLTIPTNYASSTVEVFVNNGGQYEFPCDEPDGKCLGGAFSGGSTFSWKVVSAANEVCPVPGSKIDEIFDEIVGSSDSLAVEMELYAVATKGGILPSTLELGEKGIEPNLFFNSGLFIDHVKTRYKVVLEISSGYRPPDYQKHFRTMSDQFNNLLSRFNKEINGPIHGVWKDFADWRIEAESFAVASGPVAIDCLARMEAIVSHAVGIHEIRQRKLYPFIFAVNAPGQSAHTINPSHAVDIKPTDRFAAINDTDVDRLARDFRLWRPYRDKGDPPHFQSSIAPCPISCKIPKTLVAMAHSPVSIFVTDPSGRRIGFDPAAGAALNEIGPDAHYNGFGEPQIITINGLDPGDYKLRAKATGNGPFTLELTTFNEEGEEISSHTRSDIATVGIDIQPITITQFQGVPIEIKPGEFPNSINPRDRGRIAVAIVSTGQLDARLVDPISLTFGRTGDEKSWAACHEEDVDQDGLLDMLCHFEAQRTQFSAGDVEGVLKGKTWDGTPVTGRDSIRVVPK
jgi:hypothetical protein